MRWRELLDQAEEYREEHALRDEVSPEEVRKETPSREIVDDERKQRKLDEKEAVESFGIEVDPAS